LPVAELNVQELPRAQTLVRHGLLDPNALENGVVRVTDSQRLLADRVIRELLG